MGGGAGDTNTTMKDETMKDEEAGGLLSGNGDDWRRGGGGTGREVLLACIQGGLHIKRTQIYFHTRCVLGGKDSVDIKWVSRDRNRFLTLFSIGLWTRA